jgi:hypothetical protein
MSRSLIDVTLQCLYRFYTIFYRLVKIVTRLVVLDCEFCVVTNAVLRDAILTVIKIRYLYWNWADHHTFAQYVQNISPGDIAQRDTIKIYTTAWERYLVR